MTSKRNIETMMEIKRMIREGFIPQQQEGSAGRQLCLNCGAEFEGTYCPFCGCLLRAADAHRHHGQPHSLPADRVGGEHSFYPYLSSM